MKGIYTIIALLLVLSLKAQIGDECIYSRYIADLEDYCSGQQEFSTFGATPSALTKGSCWPDNTVTNDIWFAFIPRKTGLFISVKGATQFTAGTLLSPAIAIYEGSCDNLNEVGCVTDAFNNNIVELTVSDLRIGQVYYLRVDSRNGSTGSFELCLNEFNPAKTPQSDCDKAVVLCDKSSFYVEELVGEGENTNEVDGNSCIREEFSSTWYKWICDESGTLDFTLKPNNAPDDLDFAVYRLPGGLNDCDNKELVRCMASGETIGANTTVNDPCFGETGLAPTSSDIEESPGCSDNDDNFVRSLDMVSGEAYALLINNFSKSGYGFSIEFGGTGTFLGPEVDFNVEALEEDFVCDKLIQFTDNSQSQTDPIVSHQWNFGAGSNPPVGEGSNPITVEYDSFGEKIAALTVETSRGCRVTIIKELEVGSCCEDFDELNLDPSANNVSCYGQKDGQITLEGSGGNSPYLYRLNNGPLQPIPFYYQLNPGIYGLTIVDKKGCIDTTTVFIEEPPEIVVDAGRDTLIELGDIIQFDASVTPPDDYDYTWTLDTMFLDCKDCLDPTVKPFNTATFTLTATNESGCGDEDEVTVRVEVVRDVYGPNIFSPNGDNKNEVFNVFGNKAAVSTEELLIYDRWGNLVYKGSPPLNDITEGWDGKFDGKDVELGVYTWMARVLFLDGVVVAFSGDVTVVR